MSEQGTETRTRRGLRLHGVAIASGLLGAGLLALGFLLLWYTIRTPIVGADGQPDANAQMILWNLRTLVPPLVTVGLAALVLPVFLYALRSRLRR